MSDCKLNLTLQVEALCEAMEKKLCAREVVFNVEKRCLYATMEWSAFPIELGIGNVVFSEDECLLRGAIYEVMHTIFSGRAAVECSFSEQRCLPAVKKWLERKIRKDHLVVEAANGSIVPTPCATDVDIGCEFDVHGKASVQAFYSTVLFSSPFEQDCLSLIEGRRNAKFRGSLYAIESSMENSRFFAPKFAYLCENEFGVPGEARTLFLMGRNCAMSKNRMNHFRNVQEREEEKDVDPEWEEYAKQWPTPKFRDNLLERVLECNVFTGTFVLQEPDSDHEIKLKTKNSEKRFPFDWMKKSLYVVSGRSIESVRVAGKSYTGVLCAVDVRLVDCCQGLISIGALVDRYDPKKKTVFRGSTHRWYSMGLLQKVYECGSEDFFGVADVVVSDYYDECYVKDYCRGILVQLRQREEIELRFLAGRVGSYFVKGIVDASRVPVRE